MKEWLNTATGEFKTLEDSIVIKGINWIEIPEGAELMFTNDCDQGFLPVFAKDVCGVVHTNHSGEWIKSKWADVETLSNNPSNEVLWKRDDVSKDKSVVNHPKHYVSDPCGVEAIEITSLLPACISNATKYIWREGKKDSSLQELEKALWYINYSIDNSLPSAVSDLTDSMHFEELIAKVKKHWNGWKYIFIDAIYWGDQQQMKRAIEGMISDINTN